MPSREAQKDMRQDRIRLVNELNAEDLKKAREKALRDAKKRHDSGAKTTN